MWGEGTNAHGPRMVRRTMDQHILSIEMRAVTKAVDRYLGESMPQTAWETTGGIKQEWAEKGLAKIKAGYDKLVAKGKIPQEKADAIVADLKANGDRVERLLVGGFSDGEKAALRDYVARMRANIERAQREFEHQTLPQSPVVMAPDQDGAEVANTKEENE